MQVVKKIDDIKNLIKAYKKANLSIAFVPTMGYLHEGHMSLVAAAKKRCDKVILSIFVNPMQFGENEDLDKYPRNLQNDTLLCEQNGVDLVFAPSVDEMYPSGFNAFVDVKNESANLCGASRAGHFRGVCTILLKFFNIITPDIAFFGQKDAQQCAVVSRMIKDLNLNLKLEICPIIREKDNLAKSSRNVYLNEAERKAALVLSRAIFLGESLVKNGERKAEIIKKAMIDEISKESMAKIDYVSLVDSDSIKEIDIINDNVLGAIAVYIGKTRLIDNFLLRNLG